MYDKLLMAFGHLQTSCGSLWPDSFHPWGSIFLADYLRGIIKEDVFLQMFSLVDSSYIDLGQCIVETVHKLHGG